MQSNDFYVLGTTYYEMAYFLKSRDKKYEHLKEKGYEMKKRAQIEAAKRWLDTGNVLSSLEIMANQGSCDECMKMNGHRVSLEESLENPPIPNKECNFEPYGCRCTYLPLVE